MDEILLLVHHYNSYLNFVWKLIDLNLKNNQKKRFWLWWMNIVDDDKHLWIMNEYIKHKHFFFVWLNKLNKTNDQIDNLTIGTLTDFQIHSFIHPFIYLFLTLSIIIFSYLHDCYLCCFVSTTNITTKNINNNNNNNKI